MVWSKENKEKIQYCISSLLLLVGVIICTIDFFLPIMGEIHNTSLYLIGEFITFTGAVYGISLHYQNELDNFKQEIKTNIKT